MECHRLSILDEINLLLFSLYFVLENSGYDHVHPHVCNTFLEAISMCNWLIHV